MAGPVECPNCGLWSPPGTVRCDCGYNFTTRTVPADVRSGRMAEYVPAPHGRRIVAFLIEGPVIAVLGLVLAVLVANLAPQAYDILFEKGRGRGAALVLTALYWIPAWGVAGTSVGKWFCGLRIIDARGRPPGIGRAILRWLVMWLLSPLFGLPWWPVLFRKDRRGLHDLASGTRVVEREPD